MATIGVSAKLEYENGSAWAEVYNIKTVNFPDFTTTSVETTNLANVDYGKTFIPGMVDAGVITFNSEYTTASYVALSALVRDLIGWRVTSPSGEGDILTCDGFLTKLSVNFDSDVEVMITGEIKLSGIPQVS